MIGMGMREPHAIEPVDSSTECLLTKIEARVDQDPVPRRGANQRGIALPHIHEN